MDASMGARTVIVYAIGFVLSIQANIYRIHVCGDVTTWCVLASFCTVILHTKRNSSKGPLQCLS